MMILRKQLAVVLLTTSFLLSVLSLTACTQSETEKRARELGLPGETVSTVRNLSYDAVTNALLREISLLPADSRANKVVLDKLNQISSDGMVTSGELTAFKDIDDDGLDKEKEAELGTDPLKRNPSIKYALDNGLPFIEELKQYDQDGVMDDAEKKAIDLAASITKRGVGEEALKISFTCLITNTASFIHAYNILEATSDKALVNMMRLGINNNVADYIQFVSELADHEFARYALENRLCIEDRDLTESERSFLLEPETNNREMFTGYLSAVETENPEMALELKRLADLQSVELRDVEGLEDIEVAARKAENKTAFELMLNEGIKDKRKYCSPLEALLWIAYDREFNDLGLIDDNGFSFKGFTLEKLIEEGWLYTLESNGFLRDRNELYATSDDYGYHIKPIHNACLSLRWKDFDIAIDRLNSPQLILYYQKYTFTYDHKYRGAIITAKEFFIGREGNCEVFATFCAYCLKRNGYPNVYGLVLSFDRIVQWQGIDYPGHFVCIFKYVQIGSYYVMDDMFQNISNTVHGPYSSIEETAYKTCERDSSKIAKLLRYNLAEIDLTNGKFK